MSKYDALSQRLAAEASAEWRATFAEIEKVLGFPLPPSARTHRPWWANEFKGRHVQSRAWLDNGWRTEEVNLPGEVVIFRKEDPRPSALDAALNTPVVDGAPPSAPQAPPAHEVQPDALKDASASASRQMHARSWGATAAIAGAAAVVAGLGAFLIRGMMKRAKSDAPPPNV
jgi:hypothetical protein